MGLQGRTPGRSGPGSPATSEARVAPDVSIGVERRARVAARPAPPKISVAFGLLAVYVLLVYLRPFEYESLAPAFKGVPLLPFLLLSMLVAWAITIRKNFDAAQLPLGIALTFWVPLTVALTGWFGGASEEFIGFTPIMVLFLIAATTIDTPARLRTLFLIVGATTTVMALHGIDQKQNEIGWSGAKLIQERITYVGFLNDPNDLALAMLVAIPMVLSFAHRRGNKLIGLVALTATALMLYAVYLTNSRGAVIALAALIMVYSVTRYGTRKSLFLAPVLLAVLVVASPGRISEISADESSASGRIEAWYEGFQMFKDRPISGVGKGEFVEHHRRTAHNSYVLSLAELGLVGYFLWFSMLAVSVRMLLTLLRGPTPPPAIDDPAEALEWAEYRRLARVLFYSMTAFATAAFFLSRSYTITLYLLLAMIIGLYQSARQRWPDLPAMRLKPMFGWLVKASLISIVAMWLVTRILLAYN